MYQFATYPTNDFILRNVFTTDSPCKECFYNWYIGFDLECRVSFASSVEFYCGVTAGHSESLTGSAVLPDHRGVKHYRGCIQRSAGATGKRSVPQT